jgi:hypothetical protein
VLSANRELPVVCRSFLTVLKRAVCVIHFAGHTFVESLLRLGLAPVKVWMVNLHQPVPGGLDLLFGRRGRDTQQVVEARTLDRPKLRTLILAYLCHVILGSS